MHLQLLSDETGLILDEWQQDTLLAHLHEHSIDLASLLPQGALMPLSEWSGLSTLTSTLEQYLASFKSSVTQQEVEKPIAEMTDADKAEWRASIAGGGGHRSETRHDTAYEIWQRQVVVEPAQKVEDMPHIRDLVAFLEMGIRHKALLKNDAYGLPQPQPGASVPEVVEVEAQQQEEVPVAAHE